ncbi:TetR/AcrR family transcriptional regulator [Ochrobactrum sp. AN78]|uniref:TetR/AcrR family transcriptional regulator n=1 Tax=Ochrobactrum sp. AN78 TaxID=3039853 RepID=UPI002989A8BE|nr:TetR/AcrR family transcriptional regulator [Ochrobactrum sp. AN78]MDH7793452.1 TetR/AcrR family transcriptional repressor of nem operon [Ochrobactrum sp. AN78]
MGHSQLDKQKTHDRIVEVAARRLREKGLEGIGVADLMKEAGLTVGGFYKHFASREDMVVEAMELAFNAWEASARAKGKDPATVAIGEYVETYLSSEHRDDVASGCPFAALTADMARSGDKCRAAATARIKSNLDTMIARLDDTRDAEARRKAIILSCLMTGAVGIARIVDDAELSDEILATVREFVGEFVRDR